MRQPPGELPTSPSQPHILVVDDEVFIRNALKLYFETNDYRVSTAGDGNEALEVFSDATETIDVAILDLVMPGQHGFDVLRRLRYLDPSVEIIIATGCGSMNNAVDALRYGAFDFITKPILDFDEDLLKTVEKALEARRSKLRSEADPIDPGASLCETDSPAPECGEPSLLGWLSVYEQMNRLVSEHGSHPLDDGALDPRTLDALRDLLHDGFGADAAMIIRPDEDHGWECERSWGFASPPRACDLWQRPPDESLGPDGQGAPRLDESVWDLTERPMNARFRAKWANVLTTPFHGVSSEPRLLLLFYRDPGSLRPESSPLPLLTTVLSWLHRQAESASPGNGTGPPIGGPEATTDRSPGPHCGLIAAAEARHATSPETSPA